MKLDKKKQRLLVYGGIIGGLAVLSLTFFTISQYEKAKYQASDGVRLVCKNKLDALLAKDSNALTDSTSKYYDAAIYWSENYEDFVNITKKNSISYKATAIPAYAFSMGTLVAFGLILKHAEKMKEAEEKEV